MNALRPEKSRNMFNEGGSNRAGVKISLFGSKIYIETPIYVFVFTFNLTKKTR